MMDVALSVDTITLRLVNDHVTDVLNTNRRSHDKIKTSGFREQWGEEIHSSQETNG